MVRRSNLLIILSLIKRRLSWLSRLVACQCWVSSIQFKVVAWHDCLIILLSSNEIRLLVFWFITGYPHAFRDIIHRSLWLSKMLYESNVSCLKVQRNYAARIRILNSRPRVLGKEPLPSMRPYKAAKSGAVFKPLQIIIQTFGSSIIKQLASLRQKACQWQII